MPKKRNNTQADFPQNQCLHELFEAQVERTPDAIAVVFENQQLTYHELNSRANQLAHYLKKQGVAPEVLVGLCVERSIKMIVGLLGILKAGGAYVPLDPAYPKERLAFMLADAQVPVLLTQKVLMDGLPEHQAHTVCLDTDWGVISQGRLKNPINQTTPDNLVYVIYTSGSTGQPKGVAVPHQAVNRLVINTNYINLKPSDVIAQISNFSFDAATFEIWGALLHGAKLVGISKEIALSPDDFISQLRLNKISVLFLTTALFNQLARIVPSAFNFVRCLLFGGEAVTPRWVKEVLEHEPPEQLLHVYGPTETTTFASWYLVENVPEGAVTLPIGIPISNTQCYILDDQLQQVSVGTPGELYIGGIGLARGYLNRPELTTKKFVHNPFSSDPKSRLYKTGDFACYLPDGNIEFLGRIDNQVKIRGFRIELSEIEAILSQHPDVQEVVVTALEIAPDDKRLVAYFNVKKENINNISVLRHWLKKKMPNYMIPAAFVRLDKMPLTPNGKIDRKALPLPTWEGSDSSEGLPSTPTERTLFKWWRNVLRVSQFSIHDNFFDLGGHSLLATRIISRVRETFKSDVPISVLFDKPTVATLAAHIDSLVPLKSLESLTVPVGIQSEALSNEVYTAPLSMTQQSFWLFEQLHPNTPAFNIPLAYKLTGTLNVSALEHAFSEMVRRHATLRTHFEVTETGTPQQRIIPPAPYSVTVIDLRSEKSETKTQHIINEEVRRPFDLGQTYLWRATVFRLQEQEQILLLTFHHLITDGWSIGLFIQELTEWYATFIEDKVLPKKVGHQYIDFCRWQEQWLLRSQYQSQLTYWQSQLKGPLPILELPTDYPRPPVQTYQGARQSILISKTLTTALYQLSHQHNATLFMTVLAAFKTLLYRYTGQTDLSVGTATAGRQGIEWEKVMGLFINNLVLRTPLSGQTPFVSFLSQVREIALAAYNHQDLPFKNLIDSLHPERDLSHNPLFQTFFLLQNFDYPDLNLSGLTTTSLNVNTGTVKFDLTLELYEKGEEITGWFEYNTALFSAATMQRMVEHFTILLNSIVAAPETSLSTLRILSEAERHQLCRSDIDAHPSNAFTEFAKADIEQSIPERFEQQVRKYPDHIAVQTQHEALTYLALDARANQVAQTLLKACENGNIALLFEHDISMIVGLFGVLKAGLTYVPLAPDLPIQRLLYILQDSQARVLLSNNKNWELAQELKTDVLSVINIDEAHPEKIRGCRKESVLPGAVLPDTLAYILYTSGSTGQPKGVMQNHRNVLHFIRNYTNNLHINADDKLTLFSAYSFDAAVMDIFGALLNGATLYPINIKEDSLANPVKAFIKEQGISIYHSTPTVYRHFISTLIGNEPFPKLRLIVLGGEEAYQTDVELYQQHFHETCILINGLGPTESTVSLQYFINKQTSNPQPTVPVGYPVEETEVLLLNEAGEKTALYGEIALSSAYVALGYWQKPEITQAAFLHDGKRRLYRTGDMGRLRADGSLEFVGRKDAQIKLRGYRIELGEIEAILRQHPAIQKSTVILMEEKPGLKQLVAYVVPASHEDSDNLPLSTKDLEGIRHFLKEKLPDYMIPTAFVILDAIPLLPNGKVNSHLLPVPEITQANHSAARTALEHQLCNIWKNVLNIPSIGIQDNFFDLGGHSLLAITLLSKIEKQFSKRLPLITLFQLPTIAEQASLLSESNQSISSWRALEAIQPQGTYPPFFMMGSTHLARALLPWLGTNQPVFGLNVFGFYPQDNKPHSLHDIQTLAQHCIEEIQTVQPEGPYYLAGYCGDAKAAFEIAQQLHANGHQVAVLALFDGFLGLTKQGQQGYSLHHHWLNVLELGPSYLFQKIRQKGQYYLQEIQQHWLSPLGNQLNLWIHKTPSTQFRYTSFINAYNQARARYVPQTYRGNLTLFFASEWRVKEVSAFAQLATGGIEIYEIRGYHDNLFVMPQVELLGKQLRACLEKNRSDLASQSEEVAPVKHLDEESGAI